MSPEHQQAREERLKAAWADLALSKAFNTIFTEELQATYSPFIPSFQPPDYNPHAAAQRDGAKQVIAHIHKRIGAALKRGNDHDSNNGTDSKPTTAIL